MLDDREGECCVVLLVDRLNDCLLISIREIIYMSTSVKEEVSE